MPKKHRAPPCPLFEWNHSKRLNRSLSVRAGSSQKQPSAFRVAGVFTSETLPAMNSPPCSRTELLISALFGDLIRRDRAFFISPGVSDVTQERGDLIVTELVAERRHRLP